MRHRSRTIAAVLLALIHIPASLQAQDHGSPGWFTAAQAAAGSEVYLASCAACHGATLQGGIGPALTGDPFARKWSNAPHTVDDLYYVIRTTMPRPRAGSLKDEAYLNVLAYLLSQNGGVAGTRPLEPNPAMMAAITMTSASDQVAFQPKQTYLSGPRGTTPSSGGTTQAELDAAGQSSDWLSHTHDYAGTRYSPIASITTANVGRLAVACVYRLPWSETFMTGPVVERGVMYVTTPRLTAAFDAATCTERWRHEWVPRDRALWPNSRGVAVKDGYVVRGTPDGYLVALDAATGVLLWARQVARPAAGETITMPPLVWQDLVFIAPAGSENGIQGWVGGFRLSNGEEVWHFNTIPRAGEPGAETWDNPTGIPQGGGAIWTPLSLDAARGELYVPVTNPAPDFPAHLRPGKNLYTNAIVALDARTGALRWYDQLVPSDDKDYDLTQVSPLYSTEVGGKRRNLVATGGKDGVVRILDRDTHERLHETPIGAHLNERAPITREGTHYCPGALGGIQWNGPAWHPGTNSLFVPTVEWCTTARLSDTVQLVPGRNYLGGTAAMDSASSGLLSAIDASNGSIRWQYRSPWPMVAGVTTTAGGLVLAGELNGDLIAFDAATGRELYRFATGGSMAGGVITYAVDGRQYVAAVSGRGSAYFGGKGVPSVYVFTLPPGN